MKKRQYKFSLKDFISLLCLFVFFIFAVASSTEQQLRCNSFSRKPLGEDSADVNYVLMNNGEKVYADRIIWGTGFRAYKNVIADGNKIPFDDVAAYFYKGYYYQKNQLHFATRLVHGKLNLYVDEITINVNSSTHRTNCIYWVQQGEKGYIRPVRWLSDLRELLKDCPAALKLLEGKQSKMFRAIAKNRDFLNKIFVLYNNGCK